MQTDKAGRPAMLPASGVTAGTRRACLIALCLMGLGGCAPMAMVGKEAVPSSPSQTAPQKEAVSKFYAEVLALNVHGLPTRADLARLSPYISSELERLFEDALEKQAADLARHGGTEPPLVQGSPFVSLFEGVTEVVAVRPTDEPHLWAVDLAWGQGAERVQWSDMTQVVWQSDRWVVGDVIFTGQWDFARRGRLTDALRAISAESS